MSAHNELITFLQKSRIFHNLSEEELKFLLPLIKIASFDKDSYLVREGEKGDDLFIIKSGTVEISKKDEGDHGSFQMAILHPGDSFGEMAILGTKTRLASAKAAENTTVVILKLKDFENLAQQSSVFFKISMNMMKNSSRHLHTANGLVLRSIKGELKLIKTHDQMGRFIIYLFIILTIFVFALKFLDQYGSYTTEAQVISAFFIAIIAVACILIVKYSEYPLEFYGLSLKKWWKNSIEAILFTIPILLLMLAIKWILIKTIAMFSTLSLFQYGNQSHVFLHETFAQITGSHHKSHFNLLILVYIALVPIQEFVARGCLQGALRNFFLAKNRAFLAIITSNLIFALFHGLKTFTFAFAAFLLGIFWGWIYERQKTIIGPSISHALVGFWAFGVLNYQSILIY